MRQRQRVDDMKQSEVRTHINGQWRKAGERSAARACVGRNRMRPLMFLHLCPGDLSLYLSSIFALSLTPRMPTSCDNPPAPPANLCPGVVIEKAHAMLPSRAIPAGVARHGLGEEARGREIGGLGATE